jgi:tetratricopeptide (TPR) repeat protein
MDADAARSRYDTKDQPAAEGNAPAERKDVATEEPRKFDREEGLDQHYQVLMEMGDCYAAVADFAQARSCYRRAADLSPDRAGPYVGLGVVGIETESLDDARAAFEVARKLDSASSEAYAGLAMVQQKRKDYQAAFELYLKCLELDTDNLVALLGLFQTSCQKGTFDKITQYLELYLDRHPGDTSVLFCLATLYARDGKLLQAAEGLESVLALEPDKAEAAELLESVRARLSGVQPAGAARA